MMRALAKLLRALERRMARANRWMERDIERIREEIAEDERAERIRHGPWLSGKG